MLNPLRNVPILIFAIVWLLGPAAHAQYPFVPNRRAGFETPAAAARTLESAGALQARADLMFPVAEAYLQAHVIEDLPTMISGLSVPENAAWQRTFLLANVRVVLGDTKDAAVLVKQLPEAGLRDPAVLKFRLAHPDIFGDDTRQPPPNLDAGTPEETATNYLDALEPEPAWRIIAAHPDRFLDDLDTLHKLTAQIADQNLAPRLLPLLEERAKRQPASWALRLTLAQYQLMAGDIAASNESFRQVHTWKADDESALPTATERVTAMRSVGAYGVRQMNGTFMSSRVKNLSNARDFALICLAKLAEEQGQAEAFIHGLEEETRDDEIERVTAFMLIDSPRLIFRELRDCLAKGPPPGLGALALPWLRERHPDRMGMNRWQRELDNLATAFARLAPAASPGTSGSASTLSEDPVKAKLLAHFDEVSKSTDPAAREKFLAELGASNEGRPDRMMLAMLLGEVATHPDDAFFARAAAVVLAKAAAAVDEGIGIRALVPAGGWYPPSNPGEGFMGGLPRNGRPAATAGSPTVNEQVEAVFLGQSTPAWSPLYNARMGSFYARTPALPPPTLAPWLEKLAGDASSPLHVPARVAEAYLLHDVAGQEDHAIDLLRQSIKESPSYAARFWLTAFLARRQQYEEAAGVFDGIKPIPGYFEVFLQRGRTLLQHASKGEPLFEQTPAATPAPPARRPATVTALLAELQRFNGKTPADPALAPNALATATKLASIFPTETSFPGRETVLETFAKTGALDGQIASIAERAKEFPASADARLALGEAWALSTSPEAPAAADAAYREAFRLAPDRADIAEKMLGARFSVHEREEAEYVVLRRGAEVRSSERASLTGLFEEPDALARYIRAYGEGFWHRGRRAISGNFSFRDPVAAWRKAGQDEAVIDMLMAIDRNVPLESENDSEPEKILLGLLDEKDRSAELASVIDRMLFPSESFYGLDLGNGMQLLNPPEVLAFLQKYRTSERLARFEEHARRIMAAHPGGARAPLALLTLLVMDHAPSLRAELPGCLAALRTAPDDRLANDLSSLARMASTDPATKTVALDLLTEARLAPTGNHSELATIELLAATALDIGDRERAEGALKEILEAARTHQKASDIESAMADLGLMARCGLEPEAAEFSALTYSRMEASAERKRDPISTHVLSYIEACVQYGQPEMGRKALVDFRRLLALDMANAGDPEQSQYKYRFDQRFLERMVETFVALDHADEAAQTLRTLRESGLAAAAPEFRERIESAQELLAQTTGGPGALPVAFVESGPERGLTLWWDVSARTARGEYGSRSEVSVFGAERKSLDGRYAVEILGGDTPTHLTRLAVIPHAPGRGEWHGEPPTRFTPLRFTRVVLTDNDGATVIGPSVPVSPGEERLDDPEMGNVIKTGTASAQWTQADGVLSSTPGPIPGHPATAFVFQRAQSGCEIRGARIPVHPGEAFVQSAWLRAGEGCQWGVRCLDAQGKPMANGVDRNLSVSNESTGWTRVEQRLESAVQPPSNGRGRDTAITMPTGTAFIEPVLKIGYYEVTWSTHAPVHWAGLSLRSVPPMGDKPASPNLEPDQLGPVETPSPSLAADRASTARNEAVFAGFTSSACKVVVSPESDMIVVGCNDGTLHFLEYPSGKELSSVHAHDDAIVALAVLPAKAGVYSVDKRGDAHFISIPSGMDDLVACTAHLPGRVVLSPARKWVIFASGETPDEPSQGKIRIEIVDLTTGKPVRLIEQAGLLDDLSISSDEKQFSVMQTRGSGYAVDTWELPTFNKLPDRAGNGNYGWSRSLFVIDAPRNRYAMIEQAGRFIVRTMDNEILWTFSPAAGATSLALVPKDGAVLACKADGKVWRCVSPK